MLGEKQEASKRHFQELSNFLKEKIIEIKKLGTVNQDKEFKALAKGIEEALEGVSKNDFQYTFHFSKAVSALMHRRENNPLCEVAANIRSELTSKYKREMLPHTQRVAIELVLALLTFFILGKYTEWVERLFMLANEEAFA